MAKKIRNIFFAILGGWLVYHNLLKVDGYPAIVVGVLAGLAFFILFGIFWIRVGR